MTPKKNQPRLHVDDISNPTMVIDEKITWYVFPKSRWEALTLQKSSRDLLFFLLTQDVIACTTAIRSCEMLGHWSAGLQILEFMPSVQITPDAW